LKSVYILPSKKWLSSGGSFFYFILKWHSIPQLPAAFVGKQPDSGQVALLAVFSPAAPCTRNQPEHKHVLPQIYSICHHKVQDVISMN